MKKHLYRLLLIVALGVLAYSGYHLAKIGYDYHKVDKDTATIKKKYVKEKKAAGTSAEDPLKRQIDFTSLLQRNKDVVGWIYIPGTSIDEVIMQGKDNDAYLHHNIDKVYSFAGEVFIEAKNNKNFTDTNTILYGHNMKNGSRFHDIRKFINSETYRKYRYIYIYLPDGSVNVYKTFVARTIDAASGLYTIDPDPQAFYTAITRNAAQSSAPVSNTYIMCSTCVVSDNPRRYILGAALERKVRP